MYSWGLRSGGSLWRAWSVPECEREGLSKGSIEEEAIEPRIGGMVGSDVGWLHPILAAVLPHAVFLALGGWLFYRQR